MALLVVSLLVFFPPLDTLVSVPVMLVAHACPGLRARRTAWAPSRPCSPSRPHVRYSGASLGYQVGAILGGGIAPLMATWLYAEYGTTVAISAYFVTVSAISLACTSVLLRRPHEAEDPTPEPTAVASRPS